MGALYWQLNDVWTTASWSSIDQSMRRKPLHYEMESAFQDPITILAQQDASDILTIYAVSSLDQDVTGAVILDIYSWDDFESRAKKEFTSKQIVSNQASAILTINVLHFLNTNNCPYGAIEKCFIRITLDVQRYGTMTTWHSPVSFKKSLPFSEDSDAKISIDEATCIDDGRTLSFELVSTRPQPFVWLESTLNSDFVENNILIYKPRTTVSWINSNHATCSDLLSTIRIFYPAMVGFS